MSPPTAQSRPGGKSGRAKSTLTKTAGTKKAAAKKRTLGKKNKGGAWHTILLAFVVGLALACLGFWMLRGVEQKSSHIAPAQLREGIVQPALPRVEQTESQSAREEMNRELANAVESALADLQSLAYENGSIDLSLEGRLHQADYVLMRESFQETTLPRLRAAEEEAKLAIVIDDLGFSASALRQLLELNYPVACAFLPHGAHTQAGASAAHAKGLEVLVHQPMEPIGYPHVRPGPNALLTDMNDGQIRRILEASIAAVPHAVGMSNHMGSSFTQQADRVQSVIRVLKERGLFMLDSLTHKDSVFVSQSGRMGVEHYSRNVFLDASPSREKILEELRRAERIALFTGHAVAIGHPLPETLAALRDWQHLRSREVRIVKLRELRQGE